MHYVPPNLDSNLVLYKACLVEWYLKYVPFKPLERAVTQFLKLKAEDGSDESLIVARSMPVNPFDVDGFGTDGHLSCIASRDAAAARAMACC